MQPIVAATGAHLPARRPVRGRRHRARWTPSRPKSSRRRTAGRSSSSRRHSPADVVGDAMWRHRAPRRPPRPATGGLLGVRGRGYRDLRYSPGPRWAASSGSERAGRRLCHGRRGGALPGAQLIESAAPAGAAGGMVLLASSTGTDWTVANEKAGCGSCSSPSRWHSPGPAVGGAELMASNAQASPGLAAGGALVLHGGARPRASRAEASPSARGCIGCCVLLGRLLSPPLDFTQQHN